MHSFHDPLRSEEASSTHDPPQVVVRAGKTYLCSSCGMLIEIPADVVGQYVLVAAPSNVEEKRPPQRQAAPSSTTSRSTTSGHSPHTKSQANPSRESENRLPKPDRPKRPLRPNFAHQKIDGLRVPSSGEMDRAFSWLSYQLKVLDRKESEVRRLRILLKQSGKAPTPRRRPVRQSRAKPVKRPPMYAHEDAGIASDMHAHGSTHAQERGPP